MCVLKVRNLDIKKKRVGGIIIHFKKQKLKALGGRGKGVWGIEVDIVQGAGARRGGGGLIGKQRTKGGMIGTEIEMF